MKVVILAGGLGSRITEESHLRPKPMIEIGGKPILWHIMKIYAAQGFNEFVICCGYKGQMIKEYFLNYFLYNSNLYIDTSTNEVQIKSNNSSNFKVTLVDTGLNTMTAGRINKIKDYIDTDDFFLTYGDGVADIDIQKELEFHKAHNKMGTMTIVQPEGKYGSLKFDDENLVQDFKEKPKGDGAWINGGFFILKRDVFNILDDSCEDTMWEQEPLENLKNMKELMAFKHSGFWKSMDSMKDKKELEKHWNNDPKWKIW